MEIDENLGVFEPFKEEIEKIQTGFKKAVDEEVKSQRMKTELVTNVSHDLKTPLTAIITYVNLLKMEFFIREICHIRKHSTIFHVVSIDQIIWIGEIILVQA